MFVSIHTDNKNYVRRDSRVKNDIINTFISLKASIF